MSTPELKICRFSFLDFGTCAFKEAVVDQFSKCIKTN